VTQVKAGKQPLISCYRLFACNGGCRGSCRSRHPRSSPQRPNPAGLRAPAIRQAREPSDVAVLLDLTAQCAGFDSQIMSDPRHQNLEILSMEEITHRRFSQWSMAFVYLSE